VFATPFSREYKLLQKGILMIKYTRLALMFLAVFVVVLGCGQKRNPNAPANVSGKVTYKGSPVKGGNVTFYPANGGVYAFTIRPNGTYSATDMPDGEMAVTINTESLNPAKKEKAQVYGEGKGGDGKPLAVPSPDFIKSKLQNPPPDQKVAEPEYVKIPQKYADKTKSDLKVTLSSGSQRRNFDLKDE
jgi:hypothetical protein